MTDRPTVLVPIRVLEGESIPDGVPELLADAHVVLLGYHEIPEQTAANQARQQFEESAMARLETFEELLVDAGATADTHLVFTHEPQQTIDRTIYEHECLAVLVPNSTKPIDDVLVAIRGTVGLDRLVRLLTGLFATQDVNVTLFHVAGEDETDQDVETLLEGISGRLVEGGFDPSEIAIESSRDGTPQSAIIEAAEDFDVIVMGESDPSIATFVFGMRAKQVANRFLGPVLIVQRERPAEE